MRLLAVAGRRIAPALLLVLLVCCSVPAAGEAAPAAAPRLSVRLLALPSRFAVGDPRDVYEVLVTNTGAHATSTSEAQPVTVSFSASPNTTIKGVAGVEWGGGGAALACTPNPATEPVECKAVSPVAPDETLAIRVEVRVEGTGSARAEATVQEAGAPVASQTLETPIAGEGGEPVPYAVESFSFTPTAPDGELESQAGSHPYETTISFELPSNATSSPEDAYRPAKNPRIVSIDLPEGFVGNPLAAPRCSPSALAEARVKGGKLVVPCPRSSRIGYVTLVAGRTVGAVGTYTGNGPVSAVYNLDPEAGHTAELGFAYKGFSVILYADLIFRDGRYQMRASIPGVPVVSLDGIALTLFGDPGERNEEPGATDALLGSPSACTSEPLHARIEADSWESPGEWIAAETNAYPDLEGCSLMSFDPQLQVSPEADPSSPEASGVQADSPDGYALSVKVPNADTPWSALASPEIRNQTITLPAGVSLSPPAAYGLEGCPETGPGGIDFPRGTSHPDEAGEGEAIGPDGLSHLSEGNCPPKSTLGTVEISTPLLSEPLTGNLYLAEPGCGASAPCTPQQVEAGEMIELFLEAHGPGMDVKLRGFVEVGGSNASSGLAPGQLRLHLQDSPQLPISAIDIRLDGGPRALLASPQACGPASSLGTFEPWSEPAQTATRNSSFEVLGCGAGGPFAPGFSAGTELPLAGASSPFTLSLSRRDGEQNLGALSVTAPDGVAAMLSSVQPCSVEAARLGNCSSASSIGHVEAAIGVGAQPYPEQGQAYLTGPYRGAPFGIAIVLSGRIGPFDLGQIAILSSLQVDRSTGALTITTDPLPQSLDGISLRTRQIVLSLDRPGFMVDPTDCSRLAIAGRATGTLPDGSSGSTVGVGSPYRATGCRALRFAPKISAVVSGRASRAYGAALKVLVSAAPGEANIGKVKVDLPRRLPARQSTLRKACAADVFQTDPARCPAGSLVGTASAETPLLRSQLAGPAYLVSHGGARFPDLDVVLQAEGVTIVLTGNTDVKGGITSSAFKALPDERIRRFELTLPRGPHSLLAAFAGGRHPYDLCRRRLRMPNIFTGQNGAVVKRTTRISVSGCHPSRRRAGARRHG